MLGSRCTVALRSAFIVAALALAACSPQPASQADEPTQGDPLAAVAWLHVRSIEANDVTTAVDLALVRADGSVAWRKELSLDRRTPGGLAIAMPRSGVMVYGRRDGDDTVLVSVDASQGVEREIGRVGETVVGATMDPAGEAVYLALSGDVLRVVVVPVDGGEPVELHRQELDRLVQTGDRLAVTPDGRRLVLERCPADRCTWTVLDLEGDEVRELDPGGVGPSVDLSNDMLLAPATTCDGGPCPFVLVGLVDGRGTSWDPGAHLARLGVDGDGRTLLLSDPQGVPGGPVGSITIVDPATGRSRVVSVTDPAGQPLGIAREGQDTWVPAGWELLVGAGLNVGESGGPVLMRLADGFLRQLPAPRGR